MKLNPFDIFCVIVFILSLISLVHTYFLFPLILDILAKNKKLPDICYSGSDADLPSVSILLAVYNEEKVIENKIRTTFNTSYPLDKIEFLIGSDASTDETNAIIARYSQQYPQINLVGFKGRTGKS